MITGVTRRTLVERVGHEKGPQGTIPELRWMRAMAFERLVRDDRFASRVVTTAVGELGLQRPEAVAVVDAGVSVSATADLLRKAHAAALDRGIATLIHQLAVPFLGLEGEGATDTRPDFAVVAPKDVDEYEEAGGTWLIVGDAKDYQRIRSKISDDRLLKGFLQVALGAESADDWSEIPPGMDVHDHGILAVPLNTTLSPTALVEDITDHRSEVRMRVAEREEQAKSFPAESQNDPLAHLKHLRATFSPDTCPSCDVFNYCRAELQRSTEPNDLLIEIGVKPEERPYAVGLVDGVTPVGAVSHLTRQRIEATVGGAGLSSGKRRTDPVGQPGTVNVVIAKSDGAATGLYGIATQRVTAGGAESWQVEVFDDPDAAPTKRLVVKALAKQLSSALTEQRKTDAENPDPIHLVVPDSATADILVSIVDSVGGQELTRLRFEQDKRMGRPALTFDGRPATIPPRLPEKDRIAVSYLIEQDRARTMKCRSTILDLRATLASLVTAGGAAVNSLRLDYLVPWAEPAHKDLDHRALAAEIESLDHSSGVQLTPVQSNSIHHAFTGEKPGVPRPAEPAKYQELVQAELKYKTDLVDRTLDLLASEFPVSTMQPALRVIERDAQVVWRRRLSLHASDLTRFDRTPPWWRNNLVEILEADDKFSKQLAALTNPLAAHDVGRDAGNRDIALARVVEVNPLVLEVDSRRIGNESRVVLLHVNGQACVEDPVVVIRAQKTSFKISGMSIGELAEQPGDSARYVWDPHNVPGLVIGDELVLANFSWFSSNTGNAHLNVSRPRTDTTSAPTEDCTHTSHSDDPANHRWCCRPHEVSEAEWADTIAAQRARGERNPQTWPPIVDRDTFDVNPADESLPDPAESPAEAAPDELTMDDVE